MQTYCQDTSQKPPETPDTKECPSDTLFVFLKGITKWKQSFGMGKEVSVLTPRTHTCRYLEDKIIKPRVFIHTWAGAGNAGARALSWLWWHHNEGVKQSPQGADRLQWPQTRPVIPVKSHWWNPVYKIWAVNIASAVPVLSSDTIHCYHCWAVLCKLHTRYRWGRWASLSEISFCFWQT